MSHPTAPPKAAKPTRKIFDPFNSSATGHQRADNTLSGSTAWRDSRNTKLRAQFSAGPGGGERVSDTVGAGSINFGLDGRTANGGWERGAKGLRGVGQRSLGEGGFVEGEGREKKRRKVGGGGGGGEEGGKATEVVNPFTPFRREDGGMRESSWTSREGVPAKFEVSPSELLSPIESQPVEEDGFATQEKGEGSGEVEGEERRKDRPPRIFRKLTFYINGSTAPLVSDHRLKHMISEHGGHLSVALARRSITHVILGRPSSSGGSGGGLAGSKIQKEIEKVGGKGVKFVTAEWVVDSVKAGKRLPEKEYQALSLAPKGVKSVVSMFTRQESKDQE